MLTLGIDTTGTHCSAAVLKDGTVAAVLCEAAPRRQVERLIPILDAVLAEAAVTYQELNCIGVTIGPGSFTGIRIGLAAANGVALATGISVIGVGTLHAIAHAERAKGDFAEKTALVAAIDARKGALYVQAFDMNLHSLSQPVAVGLEISGSWLSDLGLASEIGRIRFCGPGSSLLLESLSALVAEPAKVAGAESSAQEIDPVAVAQIARELHHEGHALKAEPLYIRPPDAKLPG